MARYLLDTNIIRFYIENRPEAVNFIDSRLENGDTFFISSVVKGELRAQIPALNRKEITAVRSLLLAFPTLSDTGLKKAHALRYFSTRLQKYHEKINHPTIPKRIGLADAEIAVSAYKEGIPLITHNIKDFTVIRFLGIELYDPMADKVYLPIRDITSLPDYYY